MRQALEHTLGFKVIQTSQVLEAYKELSKSMTFELIWNLWRIPVEKGPNVLKLKKIMKYYLSFWGSLTSYLPFYYSFTVSLLYNTYIFCMCCRNHVLCTTWFVISLIQLRWTKPNPPNHKYKAQDPCFYLGLGTVKNKNPQL